MVLTAERNGSGSYIIYGILRLSMVVFPRDVIIRNMLTTVIPNTGGERVGGGGRRPMAPATEERIRRRVEARLLPIRDACIIESRRWSRRPSDRRTYKRMLLYDDSYYEGCGFRSLSSVTQAARTARSRARSPEIPGYNTTTYTTYLLFFSFLPPRSRHRAREKIGFTSDRRGATRRAY